MAVQDTGVEAGFAAAAGGAGVAEAAALDDVSAAKRSFKIRGLDGTMGATLCKSLTASFAEEPFVDPEVEEFMAESAADGALEWVDKVEMFLGGGGGGGETAVDDGLDLTGVPDRDTVGDMTEKAAKSGFCAGSGLMELSMDCCTLEGVKPEINMLFVSSALYTGGRGRLGSGGDTEETLSKSIRFAVVGV